MRIRQTNCHLIESPKKDACKQHFTWPPFWLCYSRAPSVQADVECDLPPAASVPQRPALLSLADNFHYGDKGIEWISPHGDTKLWIGLRFQTRVDTYSGDLSTVEDLISGGGKTFDMRRGRLKEEDLSSGSGSRCIRSTIGRSDTLLDYRPRQRTVNG